MDRATGGLRKPEDPSTVEKELKASLEALQESGGKSDRRADYADPRRAVSN